MNILTVETHERIYTLVTDEGDDLASLVLTDWFQAKSIAGGRLALPAADIVRIQARVINETVSWSGDRGDLISFVEKKVSD